MAYSLPRRAPRDSVTEPLPRVFVSSVIENYAQYRDAAVLGIRSAGCEPIRAEDFPAQAISPRTACLDGVRSADALVLILGERYGFVGPSGLSPTEEEYEEARKTHKPVLAFLQADVLHDPRQRSLVDRVQSYVDGHWRKTFHGSPELTELVKNAVAAADLAGAPFRGNQAATRITSELTRDPPNSADAALLRTVWTTLRDEEVIDPLDLDDDELKRTLLRLGHECDPPLFSYEHAKQSITEVSAIRVCQGAFHDWREAEYLASVEVSIDGTLAVTQSAMGKQDRPGAIDQILSTHVIDPNVVRERLNQAWSFAASWWRYRDPFTRHDPLLYNLALYNVGHRTFRSPPRQGESITLPFGSVDGPLIVFDSARKVSRADFNRSDEDLGRVIKLIERRFRQPNNAW